VGTAALLLMALFTGRPAAADEGIPPPAEPTELQDEPGTGALGELTTDAEILERRRTSAKPARPPIPTLVGPELQQILLLTGATAGAGLGGLVAGALLGALSSVVIAGPAALIVRSGQLAPAASTVGIFLFMTSPLVFGAAGAALGYAAARLVTAGVVSVDTPKVPRWKRILGFAAVDAVMHAVVVVPLILMSAVFGAALAMYPLVSTGPGPLGSWYATPQNYPSRLQVAALVGGAYALARAGFLLPPGLAAAAVFVPVLSLMAASAIPLGAANE